MSSHPQSRFRIGASRTIPGAHIASRDPFKLERRREERHEAEGSLCASYSGGPGEIKRFGITHLKIVDRSPGGLGATTRVRIDPGATVNICPDGSTIPWVSAVAVRCEECDEGYRVGLRYSGAAKAA